MQKSTVFLSISNKELENVFKKHDLQQQQKIIKSYLVINLIKDISDTYTDIFKFTD